MEVKVKITMKSYREQPGEKPEKTEFVTYGNMSRFGMKYRISYEESEMFGQEGVITTFVIDSGKITLERSGKIKATMEFVKGMQTETMYETAYGTMLMQITAAEAYANVDDSGGEISLEYNLSLSRVFVARNRFLVQIETINA